MTLDELRERIKDEVVLHEGDVADYQWRQMGLTNEAAKLGISGPDFGRLVNQVSLAVAPDLSRIAEIKNNIRELVRQRRKQLTDADVRQIVDDAERARLTRPFVVDRWLPAILSTMPDLPAEPAPTATKTVVQPTVTTDLSREEIRRRIASRLDSYASQSTIPQFVLNDLLQTIPADESLLTEEIFTYLVGHLYKAVQEPQGNTLRERLVSTDWQKLVYKDTPAPAASVSASTYQASELVRAEPQRLSEPLPPVVHSFTATPARVFKGQPVTLEWEVDNLLAVTIDDLGAGLSPRNRGWVKPTKTTDYTLFDVNNNPLSTVRVEVIPRDRSGVYGVLFALALLALIYWFIKSGNTTDKPERKPARRTERSLNRSTGASSEISRPEPEREVTTTEPTSIPTEPAGEAVKTSLDKPKAEDAPAKSTKEPVEEKPVPTEPVTKPATPADARIGKYEEAFGNKPYDKIELGADERGWRRARSNGRWGYVNENDEWVIQPEYEAVTPFRGNTAAVFLNGQLLKINREGEQIRN